MADLAYLFSLCLVLSLSLPRFCFSLALLLSVSPSLCCPRNANCLFLCHSFIVIHSGDWREGKVESLDLLLLLLFFVFFSSFSFFSFFFSFFLPFVYARSRSSLTVDVDFRSWFLSFRFVPTLPLSSLLFVLNDDSYRLLCFIIIIVSKFIIHTEQQRQFQHNHSFPINSASLPTRSGDE